MDGKKKGVKIVTKNKVNEIKGKMDPKINIIHCGSYIWNINSTSF